MDRWRSGTRVYGSYGRNALFHGRFLHAVDEQGGFPERWSFSKPPLSLWLVAASFAELGPSLLALRVPFACAALAVALLLFAWGCRLEEGHGGTLMGLLAGASWLVMEGVYHYGRTAAIEPVLIMFVLAALLAHAHAMDGGPRSLFWASVSGTAVALAFVTKQIVCALALVPICAAELARLRRVELRGMLARASLALGIPLAVAGTWIWRMSRVESSNVRRMLWEHAVVNRVNGYEGGQHHNHLNRVVEVLARDVPPLSWEVCLFGFVLLLVTRFKTPRAHDSWLLGAMFATAWLAFDVGSASLLPWYVLTFSPALALGHAFALGATARLAAGDLPSPLTRAAAGLGLLAMTLASATASRSLLPSVLVVGVFGVCAAWTVQRPRHATIIVPALFGLLAVLISQLVFARDGYHHTEPDFIAQLGSRMHAAGARRVAVDRDMRLAHHTRVTFLGTQSEDSAPPWTLARPRFDAWVEQSVAPRELKPNDGVRLVRAPGLIGFVGDLREEPLPKARLSEALQRGPLTFEAEDLCSERYDSLHEAADASGGALRKLEKASLGARAPHPPTLAAGRTVTLPKGKYVATFYVRGECDGEADETLAKLAVEAPGLAGRSRSVRCREADRRRPTPFAPFEVAFVLDKAQPVLLSVRDARGAVAFDRVTVRHGS